ncbi:hypothetical protein [Gluconacetobacter johannae]|uniref:Uncharacterized protein n=1 Tax=Gluconacetobacter johannae TaxID=112140 RepID=A0A7W4J8P0_9PROT|nr:hypothetical protein [Gluconacetobacter johannae]MBB2176748.1 hypothetical protein [Gluconacetobacter johannae]
MTHGWFIGFVCDYGALSLGLHVPRAFEWVLRLLTRRRRLFTVTIHVNKMSKVG